MSLLDLQPVSAWVLVYKYRSFHTFGPHHRYHHTTTPCKLLGCKLSGARRYLRHMVCCVCLKFGGAWLFFWQPDQLKHFCFSGESRDSFGVTNPQLSPRIVPLRGGCAVAPSVVFRGPLLRPYFGGSVRICPDAISNDRLSPHPGERDFEPGRRQGQRVFLQLGSRRPRVGSDVVDRPI